MSSMQRYRVVIHWTHRKWGPQMEKLAAEGTSARRALNSALLGFFSDASNREKRRDAHRHFRTEIWRQSTALPRRAPAATKPATTRPHAA